VRFDNIEVHTLETGLFKLDGGAMFGTVPKFFWEKKIAPDEMNRIPMGLRCLLLRDNASGRNLLIDTGIGHKNSEKFEKIYCVDHSINTLSKSLSAIGLTEDDITDVIITHCHFDHVGGAVKQDKSGKLIPTFSNAKYYLFEQNFELAKNPNEREKASYLIPNFMPLKEADQLIQARDVSHLEKEINWKGFTALQSFGHTLGLLCPVIKVEDKTFFFPSDLISTAHHLPVPWACGYDMHVYKAIEEKAKMLELASKENWILVYQHDPLISASTVLKGSKHFEVGEKVNLA
jgi:glyoxylase-like metal-dependent hydrolase (beta-lactamase superfamily II)